MTLDENGGVRRDEHGNLWVSTPKQEHSIIDELYKETIMNEPQPATTVIREGMRTGWGLLVPGDVECWFGARLINTRDEVAVVVGDRCCGAVADGLSDEWDHAVFQAVIPRLKTLCCELRGDDATLYEFSYGDPKLGRVVCQYSARGSHGYVYIGVWAEGADHE